VDMGIDRLLVAAGEPVASELPDRMALPAGQLFDQLYQVLSRRNGFYAVESALHFFGMGSPMDRAEHSIARWNDPDLWVGEYGQLADGLYFFAEDVFGAQFAISGDEIVSFDPESGRTEPAARDINEWANAIITDYPTLTGWPLARAWQETHGSIPVGHRLVPRIPFALGGEFELDNLVLRESVAGMRFRAELARQMDGIPDGTQVRVTVVGNEGSEATA
jgi:hypothetical protein